VNTDGIADTITEVKYYRRDGTPSGLASPDNLMRTLYEPQLHPAAGAGGSPVLDSMIGSVFNGVDALGTNGLYTKGDTTSRPNQPMGVGVPGYDGGGTDYLAVPAVEGGAPQVGYYSIRAENLTPGCDYMVGVT